MVDNNRKRNVLIAAGLLGLIASMLVYKYVQIKEINQKDTMIAVVTSVKKIEPRTIILANMLEIRHMSRTQVPSGAYTNVQEIEGKVAMVELNKGIPIVADNVSSKGITLGLSYVIPQNMRAVSVGVTQITCVAGFPKPGDHVDVIATFERQTGTLTKTVLQNVELLALGSALQNERVAKDGREPGITGPDTVTLLVKPAQAEQLSMAENNGKLKLMLRAAGDTSIALSEGARMSKETNVARVSVERIPSPQPGRYVSATVRPYLLQKPIAQVEPEVTVRPESTESKIEVIRGNDIQQVTISE